VRYSPTFTQAVRELIVLVGGWLFFTAWTMIVCGWLAYDYDVASLPTVMGLPHWIVWGIMVPWIASGLYTIWFALFFIKDDDEEFAREKLGSVADGSEGSHE